MDENNNREGKKRRKKSCKREKRKNRPFECCLISLNIIPCSARKFVTYIALVLDCIRILSWIIFALCEETSRTSLFGKSTPLNDGEEIDLFHYPTNDANPQSHLG
ncbi:hypothetical protein CDAR_29311 [Caerostris darwini]|uniref:Uncharacterized protein n=1 Tax=Caerostris darwini TaxID=1538125 RepID=A0AAV4RZ03_9ARAC|nr:hypothetical protein CDAR_29311 [Caerostris darwini]